jgi:hypothetical protein
VGAELCEDEHAAAAIEALLAPPGAAYLHAHFAKYGCYACRIDRVGVQAAKASAVGLATPSSDSISSRSGPIRPG